MNRVQALKGIIAQQRALNLVPCEMHANKDTLVSFIGEAELEPMVPPDKRSLIARIRFPNDGPAPCYEFEGVRLVQNPQIPGGAIILRPLACMNDPNWVSAHVRFEMQNAITGEAGGLQALPKDGSTPWHDKCAKEAKEAIAEDEGALAQLGRAGGISPTDVVMRSLDGIDGVEDVIVLRFRKSGDVELTSTCDRLAIIGALQMAMSYVAQREF